MSKIHHIHVKISNSFIQRAAGLAYQPVIFPLYIKTRFGVHTFGMLLPIDILILDNDMKVIKIKKNLLPNRLFFWNFKFTHVIELPAGRVDQYFYAVGDKVQLTH